LGDKVYQLTTTDAAGNVTGVQPTGEYSAISDIRITNQLVNHTNQVQAVTYHFKSRISDDRSGHNFGYCDQGGDTLITVYVNPTSNISVTLDETVYCDLSEVIFNIADHNGPVIGDKIFTLTTTYDSSRVAGVSQNGDYTRVDLIDNLQNLSNSVQVITYHFKARIKDQRGPGSGYCSEGNDLSFTIYLNPTPVVTSSLLNNRDTICTNTLAEFVLSSPTTVYGGVITFDFTATASGSPGDLTGFIASGANLAQNTKISRRLQNSTNIPQYLTYRVIPHAHATGCGAGIPTDVVIRVNPSPIDSFYVSKDLVCIGSYSGSLALETAIGSGPYLIRWTGPDYFVSNEQYLEEIGFGTYDLKVTDANNCMADGSIRVDNPNEIMLMFASENISCHGGSDGSIRIATLGEGSGPPYSFEWFGPEGFVFEDNTTRHQYNLVAGQYTVIITDGKGCEHVSSRANDPLNLALLHEPEPLVVEVDVTDATCDINNDGSARSTVTGGFGEYSYLWEGPDGHVFENDTTPDMDNMGRGRYILWVTDANGCVTGAEAEIDALPPFRVTPVIKTDFNGYAVSCFGSSDAVVELEIIGEYPAVDFQWSNGSTTRNLVNVPAGEYHVHVLDSKNCPSEATIVLPEPDKITMDIFVEDVSCFGFNDGTAYLDVRGGAGRLFFNWEDGQVTPEVSGLTAGDHQIRISDLNKCILDTVLKVNQPDPLQIYAEITQPYCDEVNNGSVVLHPAGGTSPYNFSWNTGETSKDINHAGVGTYQVRVVDYNNCVLIETITVDPANELCMKIPNAFTPNSDGFNDYWVIGSRVAGSLGEIYPWAVVEVYNRLGQLVFRSPEGYPDPWDGTFRGHKLPMEAYFYVIFLNNGKPPISGHVTIIR
jgi:gliding motility-associated-like protein